MSDGVVSSITEVAKKTGKGFIQGTAQEISQTITQGFSQVSGELKSPEEMAQKISQMKQEDERQTQAQIADITNRLRIEEHNPEPRQMAPAPIVESARKPMVNLGELVRKKRDNKENKIAAA